MEERGGIKKMWTEQGYGRYQEMARDIGAWRRESKAFAEDFVVGSFTCGGG